MPELAMEKPRLVLSPRGARSAVVDSLNTDAQLHLAIGDIDHTETRVKSPQTDGIGEQFHSCPAPPAGQPGFGNPSQSQLAMLAKGIDQGQSHEHIELCP